LLLTGASGLGKSWLACALGHKACRENISVLYTRPQKRHSLNLEIATLDSMENQLREQIKTLALRACKIQCERMAKVEQLAQLNMTVKYDA
jgi:DNA replication protein DnaC